MFLSVILLQYHSINTIVKACFKKTSPLITLQTVSKQISIGQALFTEDYLLELARNFGFARRKPRKIGVCSLLASLCEECLQGSPSYNDLAAHIEANHDCAPSRQAVGLRLNKSFENLLQHLLEVVIAQKLSRSTLNGPPELQFRGYRRVLVQDSTIIKLPSNLFTVFSGVSNAQSSVCNARIQATYDLLSSRLINFSIDPYSKNDLATAPQLPIQEGDLVLRDRGYLLIDEFQRHRDAGANCIYRHKSATLYLDPQTLQPIDLPALLKSRGKLDIEVLLNNCAHTPVRLVAAPVDEETANLRRMRAKKQSCGHAPSKALLELMDWTIFITTIPSDAATLEEILAIYSLRWRIEVIFKAWKSHMKFGVLHRVSMQQLSILLKVRLLMIATCANILYSSFERSLRQLYGRRLSLLKFMNYLSKNPLNFIRALRSLPIIMSKNQAFHKTLLNYCCYDKRKRQNYSEIWDNLA